MRKEIFFLYNIFLTFKKFIGFEIFLIAILFLGYATASIITANYKTKDNYKERLASKNRIAELENLKLKYDKNIDEVNELKKFNVDKVKETVFKEKNKRVSRTTEVSAFNSGDSARNDLFDEPFNNYPQYQNEMDSSQFQPLAYESKNLSPNKNTPDKDASTSTAMPLTTASNVIAYGASSPTPETTLTEGGPLETLTPPVLYDIVKNNVVEGYTREADYLVSWSAVTGEVGLKCYHLQEATDVGFTQNVTTILPGPSELNHQYYLKEPNGTYYYRVKAEGNNGYFSDWSNIKSITINCPVPTPPAVPANLIITKNNQGREADFLVDWDDSNSGAGINVYELQESLNDPDFSKPTVLYPPESKYQYYFKTPNGTYYYRVCAEYKNGFKSDWSEVKNVVVNCLAPTPPTVPILIDPGTINTTGDFLLDWSDSEAGAGINAYELEVATDSNFETVLRTEYPSQSEYQFYNQDNGIFYFRVRAEDKNGFKSEWSNIVDLKIKRPCHYINFEAEDMRELYHYTVYDSPSNCWGGAYLISGSPTLSNHTFYIPEAGNYAIWVRLSCDSDYSDAIMLNIDGELDEIVGDEATDNPAEFKWINIKNGNPDDRIIYNLTQGTHTITLTDFEAGTKIDSIIITNDLIDPPQEIPPTISSWQAVVSDGFGDVKNHEAKMMDYNGSLYASTSNGNLHPAIYKTKDGINFTLVFKYTGPTYYPPNPNAYIMYRTLDLKLLDIGEKSGLYAITDDWFGSCYITKINSDDTFTEAKLGNRGWWTKEIISFQDRAYAGFYNDSNLWFAMRSSTDPLTQATWQKVSASAFGNDPLYNYKPYNNMDVESSSIYKGYLYIGTYAPTVRFNDMTQTWEGYYGRRATGAQLWRTSDGTTWESVVLDGFGSINRTSISHMTVFGGYLYVTTSEAFGPNYIYRIERQLNGTDTYRQVFAGLSNEPYFGDMISYMGRLYLTTYNWGGRVYSSDGRLDQNGKLILTPVSDPYINNNSQNSLVGDLHIFKGCIYVNTRNMTSGTNIFRAKVE